MKRFKLSRKEKLLYATPLLLPLLVWLWPMVSAFGTSIIREIFGDSLDDTLGALAGPQAVDCGTTPTHSVSEDPCAIAAFKVGKPFRVRQNAQSWGGLPRKSRGLVRTPLGQIYSVHYSREHSSKRGVLKKWLCTPPRIYTNRFGQENLVYSRAAGHRAVVEGGD